MMLGYILSFVGGIFADIARKVLLPQSEAALAKFVPALREERNKKENLEQLQIRQLLLALGQDPSMASSIEQNTEDFRRRLDDKSSDIKVALIETEASRSFDAAETQSEMNEAAYSRFAAADRLMTQKYNELVGSAEVSELAKAALMKSQLSWLELRDSAAEAEALFSAEGGSMMPMIQAMALEQSTIARIAELNEYSDLQFN